MTISCIPSSYKPHLPDRTQSHAAAPNPASPALPSLALSCLIRPASPRRTSPNRAVLHHYQAEPAEPHQTVPCSTLLHRIKPSLPCLAEPHQTKPYPTHHYQAEPAVPYATKPNLVTPRLSSQTQPNPTTPHQVKPAPALPDLALQRAAIHRPACLSLPQHTSACPTPHSHPQPDVACLVPSNLTGTYLDTPRLPDRTRPYPNAPGLTVPHLPCLTSPDLASTYRTSPDPACLAYTLPYASVLDRRRVSTEATPAINVSISFSTPSAIAILRARPNAPAT